MDTVDPRAVRAAADVLEYGGLVAIPTETVYGLAADADNEKAVAKIFEAKKRPRTHPLIVHVTGPEAIRAWGKDIPPCAWDLVEKFWPGPLTIIVKRSDRVGDWITGGQDSVALRCPSHPWAKAVIAAFAGKNHRGLAAPSANSFGRISPTTARHVIDDLGVKPRGSVDLVLDGGMCEVGVESTILNLTSNPPELLRHGAVTRTMIEEVLGVPVPDGSGTSPRTSGTLKSHYAPKTKLWLCDDVKAKLQELSGRKIALMCDASLFGKTPEGVVLWIHAEKEPGNYRHRLFEQLHQLDAAKADAIVVQRPPAGDEWAAVLDRLTRASA